MDEPIIFYTYCDFITKDNEDGLEYDSCIQCYRYDICKKAYALKNQYIKAEFKTVNIKKNL